MTQAQRAGYLVRRVAAGSGGEDAKALLYLFRAAADTGKNEQDRATSLEREANALAAVLADIMGAARRSEALRQIVDPVVDDLPHDARQRVQAYRFQDSNLAGARVWNSFGQRAPSVPPRASVMRERVRVIDHEPIPDDTERRDLCPPSPL